MAKKRILSKQQNSKEHGGKFFYFRTMGEALHKFYKYLEHSQKKFTIQKQRRSPAQIFRKFSTWPK